VTQLTADLREAPRLRAPRSLFVVVAWLTMLALVVFSDAADQGIGESLNFIGNLLGSLE
jgi:hypothetical protein